MPNETVWQEIERRLPWAKALLPIELMAESDRRWADLDPIAVQALFRRMLAYVASREAPRWPNE